MPAQRKPGMSGNVPVRSGAGASLTCVLDLRDGPRDECGVFGVYAPGHDVSRLAYFSLYALQHRGQESAGIAAAQNGHILTVRDQGLVSQVFDEQKLRALTGDMAVGHVRYSTTGANSWENTQPVWRADRRELALAHNGNLVNAVELHGEQLAAGVACTELGTAGGDRLVVEGVVDIALADAMAAWRTRLPDQLGGGNVEPGSPPARLPA